MKRFVEGADRGQSTLLPECLDEWIDEDNPVRVIDAFVDTLEMAELGFDGIEPARTGRPAFHPSVLLKLYIYGYLNRVQSSRCLEREARRNLELLWLLGLLVPDHKMIADFRNDNGTGLRQVCARFVELCHAYNLTRVMNIIGIKPLIDAIRCEVARDRAVTVSQAQNPPAFLHDQDPERV
jgi:transposase